MTVFTMASRMTPMVVGPQRRISFQQRDRLRQALIGLWKRGQLGWRSVT
jgi:hypothetical protein